MINHLAAHFFIAFLALALLSPFLPLFLTWRSAALSAVAFAGSRLLAGPVHGSDQNIAYVLGLAALILFVLAISVALAVRLCIAAARGRLRGTVLSTERNEDWRWWIDQIALAFAGGVSGIAVAIGLAFVFSGNSSGWPLDAGIALAAAATAVMAVLRRASIFAVPVAALGVAVAAIATAGSWQPQRIVEGAEDFARGRPWCLTARPSAAPITAFAQLGFFALSKGQFEPHLAVLARDGDGFAEAHWSIRQQRFVANTNGTVAACHPRADYADALRNGRIDPQLVAVGPELFSVPRELAPIAYPDRLIVQSSALTGSNQTYPKIAERIEISFKKESLYVPEDAKPLASLSSPGDVDVDALATGNRLIVAGTDPGTGRRVVLQCLQGAYADRNCRATVASGSATYSFYLPLAELDRWSEEADRIVALFERLRVAE